MNASTSCLVYYINANRMAEVKEGLFGLRIVARPDKGFSYYHAAEYHSEGLAADKVFTANETTYIDVTLQRQVDKNVFRLSPANGGRASFKHEKPSGEVVEKD